jgi:hypothetical protein
MNKWKTENTERGGGRWKDGRKKRERAKGNVNKDIQKAKKKKKSKNSPATRHGGVLGERRYSSYSFSTSVLDGQCHAPAALCPGERIPVPIGQEAGWASEPVWTQRIEETFFAPDGDRTPIARSSSLYCLSYPAPK